MSRGRKSKKDNLLIALKQAILQQAIQGKLTADWRAENPDIEPASELLKRIQAKKQKLIDEKKIRKEKTLPAISAEEIPFDLPDGWVWCRLIDIGRPIIGLTYKPVDISQNGTPVLRANNIQNGLINGNRSPTPFKFAINSKLQENSYHGIRLQPTSTTTQNSRRGTENY